MLRLNGIKQGKNGKQKYLNTSHVKVKRNKNHITVLARTHLNTSHVKVKLKKINRL